MNILAVIPARAGSKGIPNKNIRIIGGQPLVCYAIRNAINSAYITDVIVSTDSPEVRIIAEQMGVTCHWRSAGLCGDAVTLDEVVFDAVPKEKSWDYVVTLQPTSPTLEAGTLDAGIRYAVEGGYDTVISVINEPHLSWSLRGGRIVPDYEKRLNRQYLPPHYKETGAFFVSRGACVTEHSRFGANVGVFELPKEQSIDIDDFRDLQNAAAVMEELKVAIYVNGNDRMGTGHIYRALELADEFFVKPDIIYDINKTDPAVFGRTAHNLIPVDGTDGLLRRCEEQGYTLFINDVLDTTEEYMTRLRAALPGAGVVNFEDDGEGTAKADLVINALYDEESRPQVKAGERYYIPGKTFMFYKPIEIREKVERVFISFGGADPCGYSDRLLRMISKEEYSSYEFFVVLGRAKAGADELMEYNKVPNIHVMHNVSNMPEIMTKCDIGITSRGRTGYELAMLGLPTIAMAQNPREEKHGFVCEENGFRYLGPDPADEVIESTLREYLAMTAEERAHYRALMLEHDLRSGRKRVMSLIWSIL